MEANLSMVIDQVGRDKNIDRTVLLQALEQAILTAAKKTFEANPTETIKNADANWPELKKAKTAP